MNSKDKDANGVRAILPRPEGRGLPRTGSNRPSRLASHLMRFLVDAQLPPALERLLSAHGLHAEHVMDLGMESASDSKILHHAAATGYAIITKDDDFINLATIDPHAPPIVWIRVETRVAVPCYNGSSR